MTARNCKTCQNENKGCYCEPNNTCDTYEPKIMTKFDRFKDMNMNEFAEWLDKNGQFDGSPWMKWFDENYCKKCEPIMCRYPDSKVEFPCSWCELNDHKCKFFLELTTAPDNKEIIKMWLNTEVE